MAGCGYTPDQIDAMAMHDVLALLKHWRDWPPAHEAIRRIGVGLGVEKMAAPPVAEPALPASADDPSGFGAMVARFPHGLVPANR